jgi:carboxyl-terminal processing protease
MLNLIVPGKDVLLGTLKESDAEQKIYSTGDGVSLPNLVVLANEHSYSAAEVFTGTLKDLDLATVIGTHTGGKAKGQQHIPLEDGSVAVITSLNVFLPVTGSYQDTGILPDIEITNKTVLPELPELLPTDASKTFYGWELDAGVMAVEQRLKLLGYFDGVPDIRYDPRAQKAVTAFQADSSLPATGTIDAATVLALESAVDAYAGTEVLSDTQLEEALRYLGSISQ